MRRRLPSLPGRFEASVIRPDKTRPKPTPQIDQHLIFFNKLAWSIDAKFLHVGGRSRDDAPDSLRFRHDATNCTDAVTEWFHFDGGETDADLLLPLDWHNKLMSRRIGEWANRRRPRFSVSPFLRFV